MTKRRAVAAAALTLGGSIFWAQSSSGRRPDEPVKLAASCGPNRSELSDELKEMNVYVSRMQSRIVMMRNNAGVVENSQLRNALQVNADMWQDEVDHLKLQMNRLQAAADRCESQERIKQGETQR